MRRSTALSGLVREASGLYEATMRRDENMNQYKVISASITAALGISIFAGSAACQQKPMAQLVGSWSLVSFELVRPDGSRASVFGNDPNGIAFFDAGGHYIITVMRSDRPKYAINNPAQGTADENKATAQGTITYFGTYSAGDMDHAIAIHIYGSSFPNWNGTDQKRIFAITGDQLKLTAPVGGTVGTAEVVWKRAE
jgi:hypothetical protein